MLLGKGLHNLRLVVPDWIDAPLEDKGLRIVKHCTSKAIARGGHYFTTPASADYHLARRTCSWSETVKRSTES